MTRLAEALSREGRFADEDSILDVAVALERLFKPSQGRISEKLQKAVVDCLGAKGEDAERIRLQVKHFYDVRSAIVHGPKDEKKERLLRDKPKGFQNGFETARRSLFKILEAVSDSTDLPGST